MFVPSPAGRSAILVAFALALAAPTASAQRNPAAAEAMRDGFAHLRNREYQEAVGPLEQARDLLLKAQAPQGKPGFELLNVQRALMGAYRELGDAESLWDTGDWITRNSDSSAAQSLTMRSMRTYARSKRDRDQLRARYETALKADPNDRIALRLLAGVAEDDRDPATAATLLGRVIELDRKTDAGVAPSDRAEHARLLEGAKEHEQAATLFAQLAKEAEQIEAARPDGAKPKEAPTFGPSMTAANLHLKAARNWQEADRLDEARTAAAAAERLGDAGLESPHDYYFHAFLGGAWEKLNEPTKALPHFEKAAEVATIDGYRKSSQEAAQRMRDAIVASDK